MRACGVTRCRGNGLGSVPQSAAAVAADHSRAVVVSRPFTSSAATSFFLVSVFAPHKLSQSSGQSPTCPISFVGSFAIRHKGSAVHKWPNLLSKLCASIVSLSIYRLSHSLCFYLYYRPSVESLNALTCPKVRQQRRLFFILVSYIGDYCPRAGGICRD